LKRSWLKTFEDYYQQQSRSIITSVVMSLQADARRSFVWSDTGFFVRWWEDATPTLRDTARLVVQRGQFEFVTGAWVMTDEANPRYNEMLEQILEGHEWLRRNLGVRPRYGWSIDPFGHSDTMAYLLERVGFDGIVINRVHYEVKKVLAQRKALEFMWHQTWENTTASGGSGAGVLTHIFPFYSYDVPHTCGPEPAICCEFDFARGSCPWPNSRPTPIDDYNLQAQAEKLLDQYRKKSQLFRSRNVFISVGDDFRYTTTTECELMFSNYQKLFDYINANKQRYHANVRFANLSSYFDAVRADIAAKRIAVPNVVGDFFTYSDRDKVRKIYFTSVALVFL
jgi:alpha-mannosidase II